MRWHWKSGPALIVPSPAPIVSLLVIRFPTKLAPKVSNNIPRNPSLCSFVLLLIVSLLPFIYKPVCSSDLTIFIKPFIYSLEVINVTLLKVKSKGRPDPNVF